MPSPMTISIRIQPYLVDFMESIYGPQPIEFPRKDNFNRILNKFLDKEPATSSRYRRDDTNLEIQLPYFEDKDVMYHFNLTACQERILANKIEDLFKLSFRDEIDQYLLLAVQRIDAIHLFMDKHKIREEAIDMLQKDYQRFRNSKNHKKQYHKHKKISSVKSRFCPASPHISPISSE
jgi:hypothetical protein